MPTLGRAAVCTAAAAVLGSRVRGARPLAGSVTNQDFLVTPATGPPVVLKAAPRAEIVAEVWALGRARDAGVPVPRVLAHDLTGDLLPAPFVVIEWLAGVSSPTRAALHVVGGHLRALHRRTTAPADGWPGFLAGIRDDVPTVVGAGLLDARTGAAVRATADRLVADSADEPGALLHGDLKADHVRAVGDRLTGIIDWGDARVGDPWWDLARASMMDSVAWSALREGYGARVTPPARRRLAGYRMLWNVRALADEYRAGGDWFAVYRSWIAHDVGTADR